MLRTLGTSLVVAAAAFIVGIAGTGLNKVEPGTRTFMLNNSVGQNHIKFVSDAPMERINGTASGITGQFKMDPANLESTTGTFTVDVRSMKTAISKRDEHMYSAMWLDAGKYPTISFDVKGLKDLKVESHEGHRVAKGTAYGTFNCHGVSKPLSASVTITYQPESAATKKRASGDLMMIDATFSVALADHGITGKGDIIGSKVGETIEIEAILYANSSQAMTN